MEWIQRFKGDAAQFSDGGRTLSNSSRFYPAGGTVVENHHDFGQLPAGITHQFVRTSD